MKQHKESTFRILIISAAALALTVALSQCSVEHRRSKQLTKLEKVYRKCAANKLLQTVPAEFCATHYPPKERFVKLPQIVLPGRIDTIQGVQVNCDSLYEAAINGMANTSIEERNRLKAIIHGLQMRSVRCPPSTHSVDTVQLRVDHYIVDSAALFIACHARDSLSAAVIKIGANVDFYKRGMWGFGLLALALLAALVMGIKGIL